jgi:hypothetical protein
MNPLRFNQSLSLMVRHGLRQRVVELLIRPRAHPARQVAGDAVTT